jgi:SulP family sulfate permease
MAAVFAGVLLVGVVLVVAPLAEYLPKATMAGILFLVAWGLIDWHHIHQVVRASRSEAAILGITFAATLFLDLEFAILLGVLASLAVYLNKTSRPRMLIRVPDPAHPQRKFTTDPELPECPQLRIVRIDGSIWFGAVSWIGDRLRRWLKQRPSQTHLLVMAAGVNFVDVAGAEFLASEAQKRRATGGGLYLYRLKPGVCGPLTAGGYFEHIGAESVFERKAEAIAAIVDRLDPAVCAQCRARIFRECATRPGGAQAGSTP